jgi:phenylacetate-CoA ligase
MLKSASTELRWPAVVDPRYAQVFAAFVQLEASQWLPAERLRQLQAVQLAARLQHAAHASRWFAPRLAGLDLQAERAFDALAALPVLTRAELQDPAAGLFCDIGEAHGPTVSLTTSGSTGEPVKVLCSLAAQALRQAFVLRNFAWQQLDARKTYASIRSGLKLGPESPPQRAANWNAALAALFGSGPSWSLGINAPLERQLAALAGEGAHYLASYPSNLRGLLELSPDNPCGLEAVISAGEAMDPALAEALARAWGVRVLDEYSSEELGPIATLCERGRFHCMAEGLIVEILRDDHTPCAPGEPGRVVVTDLRNFATAMIRYATNDYALAGEVCDCGRALPTLARIVGRERNLVRLPDGSRFWPNLSLMHGDAVRERLRQFQLLQVAPTTIRMRLRPRRALHAEDRAALEDAVRAACGALFTVELEVFDGPLPTGPNGKFLEFQCLLPDAGQARR